MAAEARQFSTTPRACDGASMAAILAAGIGAVAMGVFVILNEAGLFAAPSLYGPAGGVSGRTTLATLVWLAAWGGLHARWRSRTIAPGRIFALTLGLIAAGLLLTYPPVWALAH